MMRKPQPMRNTKLQDSEKVSNFVFITVSTGVGGGVILNQQLQTGPKGIAGHIGHTLADPNGPMCGCGRRGCVEAVCCRGVQFEAVVFPMVRSL